MIRKSIRQSIFYLLLVAATGCTPSPTAQPIPTRQIIQVGISPAAMAWQDELQHCTQTITGTALAVYEMPAFDPLDADTQLDFYLQLSDRLPLDGWITQLGREEIVWITNTSNPVSQLTIQQLTELYQGSEPGAASGPAEPATEFEVWTYPKGSALSEFLTAMFSPSQAFLSSVAVAPDPAAMLQAVSESPKALGYLPRSWLQYPDQSQGVKIIDLIDLSSNAHPPSIEVFAVALEEPESAGRQLLLCFMETSFPP